MADVVVRVAGPTGRPVASMAVRLGTRGRRRLAPTRRTAPERLDRPGLVAGDGGGAGSAWTVASAGAAARRRWSGGHPSVATVVELDLADPSPDGVASLLAQAQAQLEPTGVCRLDLLATPDDVRLGPLRAAGWFSGVVGPDVVASWCLRATWRREGDTGDRSGGRLRRRLAAVRPRDLPGLAATVVDEARGRTHERRHPPAAATLASPPPGSVRHEATRYRTIRRALELVPEGFRAEPLLDVGCGDGRVLAAAGRLGFTRLAGIDHDPGLVEAARARLGPSASIRLGDARTTPIDDEVGTVYLFNPLDEEGVADVAAELAASLLRRPRPALVVYVNPRAVAPLLDAGLSMVHLEPQFCVLAT
ncbi:MAG: class I SAM-dependent methyltransferase [Actinobacteria bacterium]|nr:class I SAM-dependent methyltransferase [Actinomycetota bacterium]